MHKVRTSWPVATRVEYIVAFEECRKRWGLSARRFCSATDIPYSTFARWWARWRVEGKRTLLDRSRRPRRSPRALAGGVLDVIRRAHWQLGWGVRRLHAYLRQAGLIRCSLSSVYRVLRRCGALVRRPRKPKPVWTRYAKASPGERAQMDLMYLPENCYQLTLVDDCSRFLAATILEQRTTAAVCGVLPRLLKNLPFPVHCIQTDNGSEFGRDLTNLLQHLGIRHTRIRPRSPHLNGKVERVQRTVQEELWDAMGPGRLGHWERWLQDYVGFYNRRRQHSALGYTTPMEYALLRLPQQGPCVSHLLKHYTRCPATDCNDADSTVYPGAPELADGKDNDCDAQVDEGLGPSDSDGDGIPDAADACPNQPEDSDGFQDADGCPDPDNDGDGVADAADACPNQPEDFDGFQDGNGCPEPCPGGDVNGDGMVDIRDVSLVVRAFGSRPGQPRWNPAADLNHNGRVDLGDLLIVLRSSLDPTCRP